MTVDDRATGTSASRYIPDVEGYFLGSLAGVHAGSPSSEPLALVTHSIGVVGWSIVGHVPARFSLAEEAPYRARHKV
jgi:hypothetical protein